MNSLLLGVAILVGAPALKDPPKKDAALVGEWIPESTSLGGRPGLGAKASGLRYHFTADGKWIIKRTDRNATPAPREFTLNPKADPPTIDVDDPNKMLGIWKVEGDTLTICFSIGGEERPKNFTPAVGARTMMMILKRAKPKE